jgi:integrase
VPALAVLPGQMQTEYWDTIVPGLALRVGMGGTRTYFVRYRFGGKNRRLKLGTHPNLTLADARDRARKKLAEVQGGGDPAQQKADRRVGHGTFRALADEVLAARKARTRPKTQRQREQLLEKHVLPAWGEREAASITRREVVLLVERIAASTPIQANRILAIIRLLFNDGLRRGFPGLDASPAHMVAPPGEESGRDRYLTAAEIRKVWQATEHEPLWSRAVVRLAFLTAQRVGSILALQWQLVDRDLWTIPAKDFKGKRTHLVPLSAEALAILESLRRPAPADETWVFPSRAGTQSGHVTNVSKPLERTRTLAGIPHWVLHDSRTTFRTWATRGAEDGGLGVLPHVADAVLGHAESSLGWSRYQGDRDRYLLAEKRAALKAWGAWVAAAAVKDAS